MKPIDPPTTRVTYQFSQLRCITQIPNRYWLTLKRIILSSYNQQDLASMFTKWYKSLTLWKYPEQGHNQRLYVLNRKPTATPPIPLNCFEAFDPRGLCFTFLVHVDVFGKAWVIKTNEKLIIERKIVIFWIIMDPKRMKTCPFNASHVVEERRYLVHIERCKKVCLMLIKRSVSYFNVYIFKIQPSLSVNFKFSWVYSMSVQCNSLC